MNPVAISQGSGPLILAFPHTGTYLPEEVSIKLSSAGRALEDTDWHIDRLYDGLANDITTVRATFHRYVIDANRDPAGTSLYPGQNTTGLVPVTSFNGIALWETEPNDRDIQQRLEQFHRPYHSALNGEIERIYSIHGCVILYDCHSIRSRIPYLFDGLLPDFNVGTNDGRTCAPEVERTVTAVCAENTCYTTVLNGRFKGGWTTRHYGRPSKHRHAIQMELAQSSYLASESAPFEYDHSKAERIRITLKTILERLQDLANQLESLY